MRGVCSSTVQAIYWMQLSPFQFKFTCFSCRKFYPCRSLFLIQAKCFMQHLKITHKTSPLHMGNKKRKKKVRNCFQRGIFLSTDTSIEHQPRKSIFVVEIFSEKQQFPFISLRWWKEHMARLGKWILAMRVHLQETLIRAESTSSTWEANLFNKLHGW